MRDRILLVATLLLVAVSPVSSAQPTTPLLPPEPIPKTPPDTIGQVIPEPDTLPPPLPDQPQQDDEVPVGAGMYVGIQALDRSSSFIAAPSSFTIGGHLTYTRNRFALQGRLALSFIPVRPAVLQTIPDADEIGGHTQGQLSLLGRLSLLQTNPVSIDVLGGLTVGGVGPYREGCFWEEADDDYTSDRCEQPSPESPLEMTNLSPQVGVSIRKRTADQGGISVTVLFSRNQFRWKNRPPVGTSFRLVIGFGIFGNEWE